jgi:hypothetical protein
LGVETPTPVLFADHFPLPPFPCNPSLQFPVCVAPERFVED